MTQWHALPALVMEWRTADKQLERVRELAGMLRRRGSVQGTFCQTDAGGGWGTAGCQGEGSALCYRLYECVCG